MKYMIVCAVLALASPAVASEELEQKTANIINVINAENAKSDLCKRYVGTVVTPTTFDALVQGLPKIAAKGEYETTAQYEARKSASPSGAPTGLSVLVLPTDRDYAQYNADDQALIVQAGAFQSDSYSPDGRAEVVAMLAARNAPNGIGVFVAENRRVLRTYTAQNRFGATYRVSAINRHTKALHLTAKKLFSFADWDTSPVMGMDLPLAKAPQVRQTFKVALVLKPVAPYNVRYELDPSQPTASDPAEYTDRATVLVAEPKCGLVLDSTMHVLASADAGK